MSRPLPRSCYLPGWALAAARVPNLDSCQRHNTSIATAVPIKPPAHGNCHSTTAPARAQSAAPSSATKYHAGIFSPQHAARPRWSSHENTGMFRYMGMSAPHTHVERPSGFRPSRPRSSTTHTNEAVRPPKATIRSMVTGNGIAPSEPCWLPVDESFRPTVVGKLTNGFVLQSHGPLADTLMKS